MRHGIGSVGIRFKDDRVEQGRTNRHLHILRRLWSSASFTREVVSFPTLRRSIPPKSCLSSCWGLRLFAALAFEFVNGFHDTANAVATVIYTHSMEPHMAVVWSGMWNFIGVLVSSGAVAFGIVSLLPVELILQVGSGAGLLPWCLPCSSPRSSGISERGASACRHPVRTPWWARSSAWASPTS